MQQDEAQGYQQVVSRLRRRLIDLAKTCAGETEAVLACLHDLEAIDELMRGSASTTVGATPEPRLKRGKKKDYSVVEGSSGPCLQESREGGKQPFLCPKPVYDATAETLANQTEPMSFDELQTKLKEKVTDREVPDYLPRTCIRFWRSVGIIEKVGTRYRGKGKSFKREAKRAWDDLRDQAG